MMVVPANAGTHRPIDACAHCSRHVRRGARRAVAGWMAAAAAAGCTRYEVAAPNVAAEGSRVRVTLTEAGTAALARSAAGAGVVAVEGALVAGPTAGTGGDTLRLRADRLLTGAGVPVSWNGGEVAVARADVRTLERRVGDRARTAWLVAGGVAAGAAFLAIIRNAGSAGRGGGSGGPTPF